MSVTKLGYEIERAIRFLTDVLPTDTSQRKPVLFHSIRVGSRLYADGYPMRVVLAGFLHDAIEDTGITSEHLAAQFGNEVARLVAANSKDPAIADEWERREELAMRALAAGQEAAIVKAADTLDNFRYYQQLSDKHGLAYCHFNARILCSNLPDTYTDPIFAELRAIDSAMPAAS